MTAPRRPRAFDPQNAAPDPGDWHDDTETDGYAARTGAQTGAKTNAEPNAHSDTAGGASGEPQAGDAGPARFTTPTLDDMRRGFRWGALFFAAASALVGLALSLWFARLVSVALAREDWVGWVALGLLALMAFAALVIALREVTGLMRLRSMTARRVVGEAALRQEDKGAARSAVAALRRNLKGRRDMKWHLANHRENASGMLDAREALVLADRDLLAPLDLEARKVIAQSAKRVAVVTALSPAALIDVLFVFAENVRMLRRLATLYGGRPGLSGGIAVGKRVVGHLIVTGGVALTDDLVGQFLGQDLVRRLSRRMGEGLFNGALTARIGVAAVDFVRPLPHIETTPLKFREIAKEIAFRGLGKKA
ncbi:MAG: TIGR01620 family protein [Pseudomonadota bacterium]